MFFALDYLQKFWKKYPGLFTQLSSCQDFDACFEVIEKRKIPSRHHILISALNNWNKHKIFYKFENTVSNEIFEHAKDAVGYIPESSVKYLPYPCFAAQISPFTVSSKLISELSFTGNVFIWLDQKGLQATFEMYKNNNEMNFCWVAMDVNDISSYAALLDYMIVDSLISHGFPFEVISVIKTILRINSFQGIKNKYFSEIREILKQSFEFDQIDIIEKAFIRGVRNEELIKIVIQIISYLNRDGSDIEAVKEKLKQGDWASVIGGEPRVLTSNEIEQALQNIENIKINAFDVGYRIASRYRHSSLDNNSNEDKIETSETSKQKSYTLGYGKRRAHKHTYWIKKDGERVPIVKWVEATEIHPELRNDLATEIPVGKKQNREKS